MAVMIWAVNVTNSILRSESRPGLARMAFASLSLVALSTVRLAGLVFVAAFWAAAALRSRREPIVWPLQTCALFIGLPAVLAAFWLLQSDRVMPQLVRFQHPALPASPGALGVQILEGLRLRIGEVGRLVIPGMFKSYGPPGDWLNPNMIAFLPLFSAVGWGWWLMSRRNQDVALLAVPFYFGLFVFWPYDQGTRYFLPLLPMMLLSLWALFRPLGTRAEMPFRCSSFSWPIFLSRSGIGFTQRFQGANLRMPNGSLQNGWFKRFRRTQHPCTRLMFRRRCSVRSSF